MPEHIWSVLCYKGSLDQYSNQVSLLDVIEAVKLTPFEPIGSTAGTEVMVPLNFQVVTLWLRSDPDEPETFHTRAVVFTPDGTQYPAVDMPASLAEHRRVRAFMRFEALPLRGAGTYRIAIEYRMAEGEWQRVSSLPLDVIIEEPATKAEVI